MTPIGHGCVGLAIALVALSPGMLDRGRRWRTAATTVAILACAEFSDVPARGWGHDHYLVSHSLVVLLAVIGAAAIVLALSDDLRTWIGGAPIFAAGAAAMLSHPLLDAMYATNAGLPLAWPLDDHRFHFGVPWLEHFRPPYLVPSVHNVRVVLLEAATFGPLVLLAALSRSVAGPPWRRRRSPGAMAVE